MRVQPIEQYPPLQEGVNDDMPRAVTISSMAFRLLWIFNLVVGILVAASILDTSGMTWTDTHMLVGILLVALLWFLGVALGLQTKSVIFPLVTFVVGLLIPIIGIAQTIPNGGAGQYVLQGLHVVLILAAIALAEVCASRYKRALPKTI